jgi:hypothetical protein
MLSQDGAFQSQEELHWTSQKLLALCDWKFPILYTHPFDLCTNLLLNLRRREALISIYDEHGSRPKPGKMLNICFISCLVRRSEIMLCYVANATVCWMLLASCALLQSSLECTGLYCKTLVIEER